MKEGRRKNRWKKGKTGEPSERERSTVRHLVVGSKRKNNVKKRVM